MKVFEVITEEYPTDSNEIRTNVAYCTVKDDSFLDLVKWYAENCYQYKQSLKSIREVLVVDNHINGEFE